MSMSPSFVCQFRGPVAKSVLSLLLAAEPDWTQKTQAIVSVVTAVVTLVGFVVLYRQLSKAKQTLNSMTHAALYTQEQAINELFVAHPRYREYFYGGRQCTPEDPDRAALLAIADMMADFLEHIAQQRDHLPAGIWPAWQRYMRSICKNSPLLREQLSENAHWYDREFLLLVNLIEDRSDKRDS